MGNTNYRQAPKLYFKGQKDTENTDDINYIIPQSLIAAIFNGLSGKEGNAIKLMIALIGTKTDGKFGVSEKFIEATTGMSSKVYQRTRKNLCKKGWLTHKGKTITVNIDAILNAPSSNPNSVQTPHDEGAQTPHDEGYNNISNNITTSTSNSTNYSAYASSDGANAPDGLRPQAATLHLDEKNKEDINGNTDSGIDITQGYNTDLVNFPKDYINKVLSSFVKKSGTGKVKINSIKKEFNLSETDARFCVDIGTALNKSNPKEYINANKYCDKDRCLLYLDALNIEDNKGLIPKSDGSYSVYRVNDFVIDKDDLELMYGMFVDPDGEFGFDKRFVLNWFENIKNSVYSGDNH